MRSLETGTVNSCSIVRMLLMLSRLQTICHKYLKATVTQTVTSQTAAKLDKERHARHSVKPVNMSKQTGKIE